MASQRFAYRMGSLLRQVASKQRTPTSSSSSLLRQRCLPVTSVLARHLSTEAAEVAKVDSDMFCFQCEQAKLNKHCTEIGVCGKTPLIQRLQDLLVFAHKGVAIYSYELNKLDVKVDENIYVNTLTSLFSTLTNVNFDEDRFVEFIKEAFAHRDQLKSDYLDACEKAGITPREFTHPSTSYVMPDAQDVESLEAEGKKHNVQNELDEYHPDVHSVRQLIIYGLKGLASYAVHAYELGEYDPEVAKFVHEALYFISDASTEDRYDLDKTLAMALKVGEVNIRVMELLDRGHCRRFGSPEPSKAQLVPTEGKCILVSGHDMNDLEAILEATEGTGVNVYTHGEMLPAHGYPGLKKFKNLAGHWGGAWQLQQFDWASFPGPILITTNCLIEPMKSYTNRLYTMNAVGWPNVKHIDPHSKEGGLSEIIGQAQSMKGFTQEQVNKPLKTTELLVGFGHEAIMANAGAVIDAVKSGELKRIFVVGGCDGKENKRKYFTKFTKNLPKDTMIMTLGCAKFRFNGLNFGNLGDTGLPRLLDLGQCNDTYSAILVAKALAEAFGTDVNHLPLSINLAWMEQKAIAVLLSLLSMGIERIRVGPVLPAFLTPNVTAVLVEKFKLAMVDNKNPDADIEKMLSE